MYCRPSKKYGSSPQGNANKRVTEVLDTIRSSNKLLQYAPWLVAFSCLSFMSWCILWKYFLKQNWTKEACLLDIDVCTKMGNSIEFDKNAFSTVSYVTSGVFISAFVTQLIQLGIDLDIKDSCRRSPVICAAFINIIAFAAHLSMARGWLPVFVSVFGRVNHVARWGEWTSLVPFLMVMMNSIDVRDSSDERMLWEAAIIQLISVILGGVASFITDWNLAVTLMIVSCLCYAHIFYVFLRALNRYNRISKQTKSDIHTNSPSVTPSSKNVVDMVEVMNATLSLKLTVVCTLTWTLKVAVYGVGAMNLITNTQESVFQSVMDCVSKAFYARIMCSAHGASLSPEGLLTKILILEEYANASIRQFLRLVYHEIATPLNTVSMSLQHISNEKLTVEGLEAAQMASEGCAHISKSLKDLLSFQEVEDGKFILKRDTVNIKNLARMAVESVGPSAREKSINLVVAIDPLIPECLYCDKNRILQVFSILITNGINFGERESTCCVTLAFRGKVVDSRKVPVAKIRFCVKEEGCVFTREQLDNFFTPYSSLSHEKDIHRGLWMNVCISKQIVELHNGTLVADVLSNGSSFYFDIPFEICDENLLATPASSPSNLNDSVKYEDNKLDFSNPVVPNKLLQSDSGLALGKLAIDSLTSIPELEPTKPSRQMHFTSKLALVVDDALTNRMLLQRTLQRIGFTVETCDDGDVLVQKVVDEHKSYDVIFLDNMMPRLRGVDAIRILRASSYKGFVLGVTGNALAEDLEEFRDAGCNAVLVKPVTADIIIKCLHDNKFQGSVSSHR